MAYQLEKLEQGIRLFKISEVVYFEGRSLLRRMSLSICVRHVKEDLSWRTCGLWHRLEKKIISFRTETLKALMNKLS